MGFLSRVEAWNIDIDRYINRIIPPSPLHRLPAPLSRFLGYRLQPKKDVGNVLASWWSFVGAFCGLAVVAAVFNNTTSIHMHSPPALIASFGASAVLEYNVIQSPLGQPRNALFGHTFSALVGVGITKLFKFHSDFERIKWIAGAVACGIASAVMLLTGTVHPPGGASAVLAATSPEITDMGWYFVGLVMWGTTLMLIVGLVINNIQRQFPVYWWTPLQVGKQRRADTEDAAEEKVPDENEKAREISVSALGVSLPDDLALSQEEAHILQRLRDRLRKMQDEAALSSSSTDVTMVPSREGRSRSDSSGIIA